jgi:ADP-ribose pyrophosphatase
MLMFYASPGTTTERVYLYYAEVEDHDKRSAGGGVDAEQEFIEVIEMPIAEAIEKMERGEIVDGKTVIALQWYQTHIAR